MNSEVMILPCFSLLLARWKLVARAGNDTAGGVAVVTGALVEGPLLASFNVVVMTLPFG